MLLLAGRAEAYVSELAAKLAAIPRSERAKATKILVIDIERLPGMTPIFDQRTQGFIPVSKWTRLPSLLCFAAKWHGERKTEFHAAWDDHAAMVQRAWELYDQADIVVTYNGVRFDNKHLKSEWLLAGMPPPRPWKDVDLYAVNSRTFGFESKSLQHLCYRLGLDLKSGHYDAVLAEKCVDGDAKAQAKMKRYNVGDVKITEQAYDRLRGWMPGHPHMGINSSDEIRTCNQCSSENLQRNGTKLAEQIVYTLYRCLVRMGSRVLLCGRGIRRERYQPSDITFIRG
jgi:hypothetical protein